MSFKGTVSGYKTQHVCFVPTQGKRFETPICIRHYITNQKLNAHLVIKSTTAIN